MQSSESSSPADAWVAAPTVPLSLPQHPLKRRIKLLIGNALAALMPQRLARLHAEKRYAGLGAIDQWMLSATAYSALQRGNQELSSQILQGFWQSQQAAEWMQGNARYRELFLPHHSAIVAPLMAASRAEGCTQLIEIGCGRGDVLRHMAAAMPELASLSGLDLNPRLLGEAARHTADARIRFTAGDARSLIRSQLAPGTVVLTCGGVYEYWSRAKLLEDFRFMASQPRIVVALVEPIGSDHDLARTAASQPYGLEASLSHNYAALLHEAGFSIAYAENLFTGPQRWQLMVATLPG